MSEPKRPDIEGLKEAAAWAKGNGFPGPWRAAKYDVWDRTSEKTVVSDYEIEIEPGPKDHIATANPQAIGELCEYVSDLENALVSLKRGSCWCEMGIGDPRVVQHSHECDEVRRLVEQMRGDDK